MTSDDRERVCLAHGVIPDPPDRDQIVGLAVASLRQQPLNGLRHPPEHGTCGWYIWGGEEPSQHPEFFQAVHVEHLEIYCPKALTFLALPPGWRFLVAPGYIDVWEDRSLLVLGTAPSTAADGDAWRFEVTEASPGAYRAIGLGPRSMRVETVGSDPESALTECKAFASKYPA